MFHLLKYARQYRKEILLGPFFKLLEAIFELLLPLLMAVLVDQGIRPKNQGKIFEMTLWMVLLSIVGLICAIICQYYASVASQNFGTELRNQLMKKINSLAHSDLNHLGTDTLITRMTNDINQLQIALAMLIRLVVRAPFLSIGSVIMAFTIDFQAGLIFLISLPLFCLVLFGIIKATVPLYRAVQQKLDTLNELVGENLAGVRVIRAFARTPREVHRFNESTDDLSRVYQRVSNISALLSPATTLIMNLGIIGIFIVGGFKVNIGQLQQGQILALVNYMNQMLLAIIVVSNLVILFSRAAASAQRVNEVLDITPAIIEKPQGKTPQGKGNLRFDQVDFRFGENFGLVLQQVSFEVAGGSTMGIIGSTGSGKSTLSQLIPRFYDVTSGAVYVDDVNVKDWQLAQLRQEIAMVPQTAVLFTGTVRENLQWGKPSATDDQCWQALAIAQAADFVKELPDGLDTMIFEGGKNFSGGQRQRLTIARALIRQPKILVLDDSLSALDYQTDLQLRRRLKQDLPGTVLIISQRVRSIQDADLILVLEGGRLVGIGTDAQLQATCQEYQAIVASQKEEHDGE